MSNEELNDLKYDMFQIKKRLHERSSENHLLKVQVRKLQNELNKKSKQFDALLDPRKSSCIRKIITERGAGIIVSLKQHNTELEQEIEVKNACIKKLQSELEMANLYLPKDVLHNIIRTNDCYTSSNSKCSTSRTRPSSSSRMNGASNLRCKTSSEIRIDCSQLESNLRKIKLAYEKSCSLSSIPNKNLINKSSQTDFTYKLLIEKGTSLKPRTSLNVEQYGGKDIEYLLHKINKQQDSISKLYSENETIKLIIKKKDKNIEYLSNQIKHLRRCNLKKNKRSSSSSLKPSRNKKEKKSLKLNYSQDSFEEDIPEQQSKKSKDSSPIEESIESDDDDVETGDSK